MPKATKEPPGLVPIRLGLTPAERDRLRIIAAQAGKPMAHYVRAVVREHLRCAVDGSATHR